MGLGKAVCSAAASAAFACAIVSSASAGTLDTVRQRGHLVCGVNPGLPGFAAPDAAGKWAGFDVDFCRAVSAAVFGNADNVEYMPLNTEERFAALRDGKIDLLARNSTWTMSREVEYGLTFAGVTYYDGQGFMVPRTAGVQSALELDGSKVCVQTGTTTETNLADFFTANNMAYTVVATATPAETVSAYADGRCTVATSDVSQLYALRQQLPQPAEQLILPDVISKEPLGPAVVQSDAAWATLVKWVHFALLDAEELGVTSDTLGDAIASKKSAVRILVGVDGDLGSKLGVKDTWVQDVIRTVGNYGEIFERNLGTAAGLGIPRGLNQLWDRGGIQYAPPVE
jgi:general L-amino acid transport system substrate-binding protein